MSRHRVPAAPELRGKRPIQLLVGLLTALAACDRRPLDAATLQPLLVDYREAGEPAFGCRGGGALQFSFWLGRWTITNNATGAPAGVSEVTESLGGCALEEAFTAANGARGRSVSVFDRSAGRWYQTYLGVFGHSFRIAGAPTDSAAMVLAGQRASFQGVNATRITWTAQPSGQIRQIIENAPAGDSLFVTGFDATYTRAAAIEPASALLPGLCRSTPAFRQFDFAIGDWDVQTAEGKTVATSSIRPDLDGCLVEERLSSHLGPESVSYFFHQPANGSWIRAYADNQGRHFELQGKLMDDVFTFGLLPDSGQAGQEVRNSFRKSSDGKLIQEWRGLTPGGAAPTTLIYAPRRVGISQRDLRRAQEPVP